MGEMIVKSRNTDSPLHQILKVRRYHLVKSLSQGFLVASYHELDIRILSDMTVSIINRSIICVRL